MARRIQFRRGTSAQHSVFVGAPGEITVDTDKNVVVVHDGSTPGGFPANRLDDIDGVATFTAQVSITSAIASTSTTTGALVVNGGIGVSQRVTAATFVETSSIAFKDNIKPLENALNFVNQLQGVIYKRKDTNEIESGLIAEQVVNVIPELVSNDDQGKPYGIKYTKIIAYLIEAIKEQQTQINELKNRK
jgi:hypothetical protein